MLVTAHQLRALSQVHAVARVCLKTKCQYTSDSSDCGATGHDLNLVSFHPFNGTESADF